MINFSFVSALFSDPLRFKKLYSDPTYTRRSSLKKFLSTLKKRGEITESNFQFLRLKAIHFGRAHGLPDLDITKTPHYNVGKFRSELINPLTLNEYSLSDSSQAVSDIKSIYKELWVFLRVSFRFF